MRVLAFALLALLSPASGTIPNRPTPAPVVPPSPLPSASPTALPSSSPVAPPSPSVPGPNNNNDDKRDDDDDDDKSGSVSTVILGTFGAIFVVSIVGFFAHMCINRPPWAQRVFVRLGLASSPPETMPKDEYTSTGQSPLLHDEFN